MYLIYINIYHLVFYVLYFLNREGTHVRHTFIHYALCCILCIFMHTGGTYLRISCYRSITEGGNIYMLMKVFAYELVPPELYACALCWYDFLFVVAVFNIILFSRICSR